MDQLILPAFSIEKDPDSPWLLALKVRFRAWSEVESIRDELTKRGWNPERAQTCDYGGEARDEDVGCEPRSAIIKVSIPWGLTEEPARALEEIILDSGLTFPSSETDIFAESPSAEAAALPQPLTPPPQGEKTTTTWESALEVVASTWQEGAAALVEDAQREPGQPNVSSGRQRG